MRQTGFAFILPVMPTGVLVLLMGELLGILIRGIYTGWGVVSVPSSVVAVITVPFISTADVLSLSVLGYFILMNTVYIIIIDFS